MRTKACNLKRYAACGMRNLKRYAHGKVEKASNLKRYAAKACNLKRYAACGFRPCLIPTVCKILN